MLQKIDEISQCVDNYTGLETPKLFMPQTAAAEQHSILSIEEHIQPGLSVFAQNEKDATFKATAE